MNILREMKLWNGENFGQEQLVFQERIMCLRFLKKIEELKNILSSTSLSVTNKALEAFTWGARGQFFWDGNKRTSLLLANQF